MNPLESNLIAVVDVETTGLSPWRNDRIVEIAVLLMSPDGTIHREYETLVNPDRDLGPSRIHRITAGEILHAPKFSDIAGDVGELLSNANILAGHNVSFDRNFLIKEYERVDITMPYIPFLCTCQLLGRNNLTTCCQEFEIVFEGEPHRAMTDARATACLVQRLIAEDPTILEGFQQSRKKWPSILPLRTPPVSRAHAQEKLREPPTFLQRIHAKVHHDTDATTSNVLAYLALIDRILEDRVIDIYEENALVDAVTNWNLSISQVKKAHQTYIHNLAVLALADGVITNAERSDLYQVARLLGYDESGLNKILESVSSQLCEIKTQKISNFSSEELYGKRVCFTGELQSCINGAPITRDIAKALAEQAGMVVSNSVTKKLDLLVVADPNTQSGKAKKARQYGTRIIAEAVFWRMIGVVLE